VKDDVRHVDSARFGFGVNMSKVNERKATLNPACHPSGRGEL